LMFGIKLPSIEEWLKWCWESLNLFCEDVVRLLEWLIWKATCLGDG